MIAKVPAAQTIIADKSYDSKAIREQAEQQGAKAVISRKRNSVKSNVDLDKELYKDFQRPGFDAEDQRYLLRQPDH